MRILFVVTLLVAAGCSNKLSGDVSLDGASWAPTHCKSGMAYGFSGVQFADDGGKRVRVVADPVTNSVRVSLFAGSDRGEELGACAKLDQRPQSSTINGIQNQQGSVSFDCNGGGHRLSGSLTFANCH